jgi:hypothetical protein
MSYYLSIDGQTKGPYSIVHLQAEFKAGRINSASLCWADGWPTWLSIAAAFPDWKTTSVPMTPKPTVTPGFTRRFRPMEWAKLLLVLLAGVASSLTLGGMMALGEVLTGYYIYGFLLWAVVPVGALCAGMGGAAGCYYMALWTDYYPRFLFFVGVVALGVLTLVTTHYIVYSQTLIDQVRLRDSISFEDYLTLASRHVAIKTRYSASAIELGELSKGYFALQIIGFIVGGMMIFVCLRDRSYCRPCRRYRDDKGVAELHEVGEDAFSKRVDSVRQMLQAGRYREALACHPAKQSLEKRGFVQGYRSVIASHQCPACASRVYKHSAYKCAQKDQWAEITSVAGIYADQPNEAPTH